MAAGTPWQLVSRGLALGGTGALCAAVGAALTTRVADLADGAPPARLDELVELGVLAVGVVVLAWLAGSATLAAACLTVRTAGRTWRRGEACVHRFAPAVVRRALAVAVAAGLGVGGAGIASADDLAPEPSASTTTVAAVDPGGPDLGWVVSTPGAGVTGATAPAPEPAATPAPTATHSPTATPSPRAAHSPAAAPTPTATATPGATVVDTEPTAPATGSPAAPAPASAPPSTPAPATAAPARPQAGQSGTVTVAPGDTLWALAARHLGGSATDAQIAASWPAWYAANAAVIGADPDLILPGQVLAVPDGTSR